MSPFDPSVVICINVVLQELLVAITSVGRLSGSLDEELPVTTEPVDRTDIGDLRTSKSI